MSAEVAIYLRNEQVIVVPQGGGGSYSWDAAPPVVVTPDADAVAAAIAEGLAASRGIRGRATEPPAEVKPSRSVVLRALGVKSHQDFYRGATHCALSEEEDGGELTLYKRVPAADRSGFDSAPDPVEIIESREDAGVVVLRYLRDAPPMPG
jgi:hypothetical protein